LYISIFVAVNYKEYDCNDMFGILNSQFFISTTYTQYRVKDYKQTKNGSNTYTNNNYHTQTNKKAVSQYNKCNQMLPVLSSKDHLIKKLVVKKYD
jgi:NADH:ubiquinone oxidoreductase subunit C